MRYSSEIHKNYAEAIHNWLDNRQIIQARGFIYSMARIKHGAIKPLRLPGLQGQRKVWLLQEKSRVKKTAHAEEVSSTTEAGNSEAATQQRSYDGDVLVISPEAQQAYEQISGADTRQDATSQGV